MSEAYELLLRTQRAASKTQSIGVMPAGATLSEALHTLADAVEGAMGEGCTLIDSWGIGFQFQRDGHLFDLRLVSSAILLQCFYSPTVARTRAAEVETQEAKAVVAKMPRPPRKARTAKGAALKQEVAARMAGV